MKNLLHNALYIIVKVEKQKQTNNQKHVVNDRDSGWTGRVTSTNCSPGTPLLPL